MVICLTQRCYPDMLDFSFTSRIMIMWIHSWFVYIMWACLPPITCSWPFWCHVIPHIQTWWIYLDSILAASTGSPLDQGIAGIDDSTDSVCIGVQLGLKCLMFLMLTLTRQKGRGGQRNTAWVRTISWRTCYHVGCVQNLKWAINVFSHWHSVKYPFLPN